jgi:gliding motility-associated-like protein
MRKIIITILLSFFLSLLISTEGFSQVIDNRPISSNVFIVSGIFSDTIAHVVWEKPDDPTLNFMIIERSFDGINFTKISSAYINSLIDIHAANYNSGINYFNNILASTEHGYFRYMYNDVVPGTDLNVISTWYRITFSSSSGIEYVSPVYESYGKVKKIENPKYAEEDTVQTHNSEKANCPGLGTPPSGYITCGSTITTAGQCCYYIEQPYVSSTPVEVTCGGSSYAWCCDNVPESSSCLISSGCTGYAEDPCCVHACSQYYSCSCPPWICCTNSNVSTMVVIQSTVLPGITVTANTTDETCTGMSDGSIYLTVSNGQAPVVYIWSNGSTSQNLVGIPGGTYSVTVTDAYNCQAIQTYVINSNPGVTPDAGPDQSICLGQSATLTASGGAFYQWSNGINTQSITVNPTSTSTYTVTVSSAAGCSGIDNVIVSITSVPASAGSDQVICSGQYANLSASGGISYQWSNSSSTQNISVNPNSSSTFTVTVTDVQGCTALDDVFVTVNNLPTASAGPDQTICFGNTANLNGSGGLIYLWSPTPTLSNPAIPNPVSSALITTSYSLTVTDINGCSSADNMVLTVNPLPVANAGIDQSICLQESANLNASGGVSYSWSPSTWLSVANISNPVSTPQSSITYTVTVTDGNGCTGVDDITVTVNTATADAGADQVICSGQYANLSASGGISYYWNNSLSTQSISVNPTTTSTFTVTVTDAQGCTALDNVLVTVNNLPPASAGPDQAICFGNTANLIASGGINYLWSPASTLSNAAISNPISNAQSTTTYSVTVTDANGCSAADDMTLTVNPLPIPFAGVDQSICLLESANLNASGGVSYVWSPNTWLNSPNISNPISTPNSTITYVVTVTDANGCTGFDDVTVTVTWATANAGTDQIICAGQNANLTAFGGMSYLWSNGQPTQSTNVSPPATTLYSVTVTDADGCTDEDDVLVTVNNLPPASAGPDQAICFGNTANLNASGGISYLWSPASTLSNAAISNPVSTAQSTTTYTVTVTDANGCSAADGMTLTVNPLPVANAGLDQTICIGSDANLNASGGIMYNWSPSTWLNVTNISNPVATPADTITYTLTVTDVNGCTDVDDMTVNVNLIPTSTFILTSPSCVGLNSTITYTGTASASAQYNWNFDGGTIISGSGQGPYLVSWSSPATYYISLTVTENNCTSPVTTIPQIIGQVTATLAVTDSISCYGFSDGSVTVTALGQPAYSYAWSDLQTGITATGLDANTLYTVTITDSYGCTTAQGISLTQPQPLTMNFITTDALCYNSNDGSASALVTGGTTSYQYVWQPSGTATNVNSVSTLHAGTYTLSVTDLHGCSIDTTFIINQPPLLTYTYTTDSVNCYAGSDGSILINTSGGTPQYSYEWNPSVSTGPTAGNLSFNTYYVTITDSHGCDTTAFINVYQPPQIVFNTSGDVTICYGQSTIISANATGGTGSYTFTWDNGLGIGSSFNVNPTVTTTYTVMIADANGCTVAPQSLTVTVHPIISVNVIANPASLCWGQSTQLTATASGGNGNYVYTWGAGIGVSGSTITVTPSATTMYPVTVTDNCGSPAGIDSVEVVVNPLPLVQFAADTLRGCEPLFVNFTDISTPAIGSWLWNFGDPLSGSENTSSLQNPSHFFTSAGSYTITLSVITNDSCPGSYVHQDMIEVYPNPVASFTFHPATGSTLDPVIQFYDLSSNAYYWSWNFGEASSSSNTSGEANPTHSYGSAGTFTITLMVETLFGCVDTTSQDVLIRQEFSLFVPNAFTPNNDGDNDGFSAEGVGVDLNNFEMFIYDRWGELVFKTNDFYEAWDGKVMHGDKIAPIAVYSWLIHVKDVNGEPYTYIGRVTLVR